MMKSPYPQESWSFTKRRNWLFWATKMAGRVFLHLFFHLETLGRENLPKESAFVLLAKHQRWEDIPLLGLATPRALYYVAKYELFKNPLSNWFLGSLGGIPLNRQRPVASRRSLGAIIEYLKRGEGVVVFPEGTYYRNKMGPGRHGILRLVSSRVALPYIPVGIHYSEGGYRTRVKIHFGIPAFGDPSIDVSGFLNQMMKEIAYLSELEPYGCEGSGP